jgi:hypothetical protein
LVKEELKSGFIEPTGVKVLSFYFINQFPHFQWFWFSAVDGIPPHQR